MQTSMHCLFQLINFYIHFFFLLCVNKLWMLYLENIITFMCCFFKCSRHVLLFTASSPIGHNIHLCSMVPCVFGEEDIVLPNLEKVFVTIVTGFVFSLTIIYFIVGFLFPFSFHFIYSPYFYFILGFEK